MPMAFELFLMTGAVLAKDRVALERDLSEGGLGCVIHKGRPHNGTWHGRGGRHAEIEDGHGNAVHGAEHVCGRDEVRKPQRLASRTNVAARSRRARPAAPRLLPS